MPLFVWTLGPLSLTPGDTGTADSQAGSTPPHTHTHIPPKHLGEQQCLKLEAVVNGCLWHLAEEEQATGGIHPACLLE